MRLYVTFGPTGAGLYPMAGYAYATPECYLHLLLHGFWRVALIQCAEYPEASLRGRRYS